MTKSLSPDPFYDGQTEKIVDLEDPGEAPQEMVESAPVGIQDDGSPFVKNALLLPDAVDKRRRCPACGSLDFGGRNLGGVITYTCAKESCKNQWGGGLPMVAEDPRRPSFYPPTPGLSFERHPKYPEKWVEVHRPVDTTQPFRKGAKLPDGE